jgi:hypothetical protein
MRKDDSGANTKATELITILIASWVSSCRVLYSIVYRIPCFKRHRHKGTSTASRQRCSYNKTEADKGIVYSFLRIDRITCA